MIERWHNIDKKSNKEIAELLDKSERTIRREIKRGLVIVKGYMWEDIEEYSAKIAQRKKLDKELSNDEQRNEVLLEIELTNNKIDNEKKKRKKLMDGYLNGIFDNDDYIASKEEINTAIQKLEDYNIGLGRVMRDSEAQKLIKCKNQIHTKDIVAPYYETYKNNSDTVKRQAIDYYFWLVRDFLHSVDRLCMMFGLEGRTPFLDENVYEVARKMPTYAKITKETTKPALRLAAKKVIPNEAYKKKKLGFPVPLREWVREEKLYKEIKDK